MDGAEDHSKRVKQDLPAAFAKAIVSAVLADNPGH
jgi:hypothetical protein